MKFPNGFGSVHKLTGKRRNPWRARKTASRIIDIESGKSKQTYITIGYYATRQEAISALVAYNENPYDIKTDSITFSHLYDKWSEEHFEKIVPSATRTWRSAYNHCTELHDMRMKDIRTIHLEQAIKNANVGDTTKSRIKSLFNLMYKYALKHEIVDKDYAQLCDTVKQPKAKIDRIPYSEEEISMLWNNIDFPFVKMVLIGIYSGWRPQELSILKTSDINLVERTMFGGMKTDAGRNRCVPIHSKIYPLISSLYNPENEYLFNDENGQQGTNMTYDKYRGRFNKINAKLKMNHKPHDTRHTFITMAKNANMDEYIIKLIVGHSIEDITEKVYTHRTMEKLQEEIEKIK